MSDRPQRASKATRPVSDRGEDDSVLPFSVEPLDVRGRVVRLGASVDHILGAARLSGAGCASRRRGSGADRPARVVAEDRRTVSACRRAATAPSTCWSSISMRPTACAPSRVSMPPGLPARLRGSADLLGTGHLAFTVDQGDEASRYQGIVALEGQGLEQAAHQYFHQSEQIPTQVRLAVAQSMTARGCSWRAGGLMVQFLPSARERRRPIDLDPGDAPDGILLEAPAEDDAWMEAKALAATIEDHELVDPTLSSERLLYRLFHEPGVKVFGPKPVRDACRCSDEGIKAMLRGFPAGDRKEMIGDDGMIGVTCEFCSTFRAFDPKDFEA